MEPARITQKSSPARHASRQRALARELQAYRAKVNAEGMPAPAPPKRGVLSAADVELLHGK